MFFRRVFSRKEHSDAQQPVDDGRFNANNDNRTAIHHSPYRSARRGSTDDEKQRSLTVIQLTPLWEHIIRTKCLPENLNEKEMFNEFIERLRDPEWQVRQHALRVLVDVLIVMGQRSDQYFQPIICPLVENLGHSAPAIRKGALDALKVYMTETAMPETIVLEIINLGMEQKKLFEQYGGRICVGVMLSLPSLVYTSLGTAKQNYVLRAVIDALTNKMVQVTYQEIALKVLLRIREMIGAREFSEYMAHGAYRDFELLCNVYGLPSTPSTHRDPSVDLYLPQSSDSGRVWNPLPSSSESNCKVKRTELCWRDESDEADDEENNNKLSKPLDFNSSRMSGQQNVQIKKGENEKERVIMETEITIQDTAVTMRILEANSNSSENEIIGENSEDDLSSVYEHSGVVRVLTDSELDETNGTAAEPIDSARNPAKRVTFGGEEVKLRTPDSDSVLQSDNDDAQKIVIQQMEQLASNGDSTSTNSESDSKSNKNFLTVRRPKTANIIITAPTTPPPAVDKTNVSKLRHKSASPIKRNRRPSYSSTDEMIISPKTSHKGIEVLHNLQQRSPNVSPSRSRKNSLSDKTVVESEQVINMETAIERFTGKTNDMVVEEISSPEFTCKADAASKKSEPKTSWENLRLVDENCLKNIKSGDWRLRSNAMCTIEEMLKSTDNLSLIQPHLESLFRTLLSSEKHPDVIEDKRRIIINLISRLPLDNLEDRATQIILGLCRQGGPGSNRVAKALMQRLPPTAVVHKLISDDFLKARSSRFRENALQMVLYSLMTFPSTYFDIATCVKKSAEAANDRKKRVRQAALDVLAVLGQISSPKLVLDEVIETLKDENDSIRLIAAVKARLSRKQLPTVTADGSVQYALRIPTPPHTSASYFFGADIDWITAGIGSVSPTSLKKRFDATQQPYNYSSSDSNRSTTDSFRRTKEICGYFGASGNEYEYGGHHVSPNGNVAIGFHKVSPHDDKNTHFVIATTIPSNQMPYVFSGGGLQKMNMQSQSFPDLTQKMDTKTGPYAIMRPNHINSTNKLSKLPVASRFPSMESNMEARNITTNSSKLDSNYFLSNSNRYVFFNNNNSNTNGNNANLNNGRQNGSLPRKFNINTNIPIRNTYYTDSHGAPDYQSSNEESRPSTHPIENTQQQPQQPKRFINVDRYFGERSGDSINSVENRFRYNDQVKPFSGDNRTICNEDLKKIRRHSQQSEHIIMNDADIDAKNISTKCALVEDSQKDNERSKEAESENDSTDDDDDDGDDDYDEKDGNLNDVADKQRPHSHASSATTKSLQDSDGTILENQSKAITPINRSRSPSVHESTTATSVENVKELTAVENEKINHAKEGENLQTTLEIEKEMDSNKIENQIESNSVGNDKIDGASDEKTNEILIESGPAERLLQAKYVADEKASEVDDNEPKSDSDSRSLTSTEESSDYPVNTVAPFGKVSLVIPINEQKLIKPLPKFRPAMLMRRNKISPAKCSVSLSSAPMRKHKSTTELFPSTLRKFDKPREASINCLSQLDSPNWEITMNGLQQFVRLIRHHPETIEANLHAYCVTLAKHVKNLRSQVSRSACQASAEFFQTHAKHLEQECEDLATQLLNRTADTNKFLRADALRALCSMCDNLPAIKVIQTILTRGATHQNAIVRTTSANLCSRVVSRLGCDKMFSMNRDCRDKLILAGANFLMEGSLETRNNAKALFKQLSTHPQYNRVLLDVIPPRIYRNIEKALRSIK